METLEIDGAKFVKASRIAQEFGYTSDYIGQLCRTKKVQARLVGRSWYVSLESLKSHKENRYKTQHREVSTGTNTVPVHTDHAETKGTQTESLKPSAEANQPSQKSPVRNTSETPTTKRFYSRAPYREAIPNYAGDDSELIPTVSKLPADAKRSGEIDIELAEATTVPIESKTDSYTLKTTERPAVRFAGSLDVETLPSDTPIELPPEETDSPTLKKRTRAVLPVRHARSSPPGKAKIGKKATRNPQRSDRRAASRIQQKNTPPETDSATTTTSGGILALTTIASLLFVLALMSLEAKLNITSVAVSEQIVFSVEKLVAAVYSSK